MIYDAIPFDELWDMVGGKTPSGKAIAALVHLLERKLGILVVYDARDVQLHSGDIADLLLLARELKEKGIITSLNSLPSLSDEPQLSVWTAACVRTHSGEPLIASGGSLYDPRLSLIATLAEAVERYVWANETDYFDSPKDRTVEEAEHEGHIIEPKRFAGFSELQRGHAQMLRLEPAHRYRWVRGRSLITKKPLWIPAQTISGAPLPDTKEPLIRQRSTSGVAVRPRQTDALLYAALELVERDAFMVMWLNQLSLPRIDLGELSLRNTTLPRLLKTCARYGLRPHVMRMITDVPTYAVCAVIEDETGSAPRLSFGLKAHHDQAQAVYGALLEALRIRQGTRKMILCEPEWNKKRKTAEVGHFDRLLYWADGDRLRRLDFIINGPIERFIEPWEGDSDEEHLARITDWCRERGYEFASVALTHSKGNPTPWHIEAAVIPELQPLHLSERQPHIGGKRLAEIPKLFGYTSLAVPHTADPHPFA